MKPTASPLQSREIEFQGQKYNVIREGQADILTPVTAGGPDDKKDRASVFYNPVQQYNRDLSVLAIRAFWDDYTFVREEARVKRQQNNSDQRGKKRKRDDVSQKEQRNAEVPPVRDTVIEKTSNEQPAAQEEVGASKETAPTERQEILKEGPAKLQDEGSKRTTHEHESFTILDALSATGLRALRYAKEIPMATQIVANDMSAAATEAIKRNAEYNSVRENIQVSTADAIEHMQHTRSRCRDRYTFLSGGYQVIDLDPYGTAAPFIDSALRALTDGGLLCVTCTDAGVFASLGYLEKAFAQYGGVPLEGPSAHEGGLRLIVQSIATTAARYGLTIEPLLSLSIDFYVRLFIRVHRSPSEVKFLASKTMYVHHCDKGCGARSLQYAAEAKAKTNKEGDTIYQFKTAQSTGSVLCEHCGSKTHLAGPMWGGPLHNPHFVRRILSALPKLDSEVYQTLPRMEGMLSLAEDECVDLSPSERPPKKDLPTSKPTSPEHQEIPNASPDPPATPTRPIKPLPPQLRTLHPFFLHPPSLAKVLHAETPSDAQLRGALLHLGYKATRSHTKAGSITTDAPWTVVWNIMRAWVAQHSPIKEGKLKDGSPGWAIMNKTLQHERGVGDAKSFKDNEKKATSKNADNETVILPKSDIADLLKFVEEVKDSTQLPGHGQAHTSKKLHEESSSWAVKLKERRLKGAGGLEQSRQNGDMTLISNGKSSNQNLANGAGHPEIVFDARLGRGGREFDKVFYAHNPPNWGPKRKATGS